MCVWGGGGEGVTLISVSAVTCCGNFVSELAREVNLDECITGLFVQSSSHSAIMNRPKSETATCPRSVLGERMYFLFFFFYFLLLLFP